MKNVFVGIDVSKDWIDYASCKGEDHQILASHRVANDVESITEMCAALAKKHGASQLWFCFEHTGSYGLLLSCVLEDLGLSYCVLPALEIKQSLGMTRGKNDQVDAVRITQYAATHHLKLKPSSLPSQCLMQIKELLSYRRLTVKIKVQLQNSLKAHQLTAKIIKTNFIISDIEQKLSAAEQDIKRIEEEINALISSQPDLKQNFGYITSVKGIGLMIAAYMLVNTNNFTSFDNPRKFNCYAGLAPFEHSSGISIRGKTKTSSLANKTIKTLLYNGAMCAANHDPQLKKYYQRKRQEGKEHKSVINAIACKLVSRAFATVKRQANFVVLAN